MERRQQKKKTKNKSNSNEKRPKQIDRLCFFNWTYKETTFLCKIEPTVIEREKKVTSKKTLLFILAGILILPLLSHFPRHTDQLVPFFSLSFFILVFNHVFFCPGSMCIANMNSANFFLSQWSGHWFGREDFFLNSCCAFFPRLFNTYFVYGPNKRLLIIITIASRELGHNHKTTVKFI